MELNDIVFLEEDTPATIAIKTVDLFVGTNELRPRLEKLGINYTKVVKGLNTYYYLKGKSIGTIRVKL